MNHGDQCASTRIVADPDVLSGAPRFAGSRIAVRDVAAMVANGVAVDAILRTHPRLTERHVELAVAHARAHPEPPPASRPFGPRDPAGSDGP